MVQSRSHYIRVIVSYVPLRKKFPNRSQAIKLSAPHKITHLHIKKNAYIKLKVSNI